MNSSNVPLEQGNFEATMSSRLAQGKLVLVLQLGSKVSYEMSRVFEGGQIQYMYKCISYSAHLDAQEPF